MLRGPFKFRGIVIMWSCISSYFIYSDGLFLYYLVYLSLPLYLLSLVFSSTSLRSPSIISSIHIFVFNLFRTLLLCPLKSFWLSYSVSQSKFQSSRFFYAYSLSLSLPLFLFLSLSTLDVYDVLCALVLHEEKIIDFTDYVVHSNSVLMW